MKRALVLLAVAGLVLSALGFQSTTSSSTATTSIVTPRITQPVNENQRALLKGNTHLLARPQYDRGAAPAGLPLDRMLLVLKRSPEQQSALRQLLDEQQDKNSPRYHKWLTPDAFGKQFGPADEDIQVTTAWLQQHGFRVDKVARGRTVIEFSGTAEHVQATFGTSIHNYVVNGKAHWANASDPQIPAALSPVVGGVFTMHSFRKKPMLRMKEQRLAARYVKGQPLTTFPGNPPFHALAPTDFSVIYNTSIGGVSNGFGVTIAVVGRSNIFNAGADVQNFGSLFGCCSNTNVILNGPDPGDLGGGEEAEATLDTTWAGAVAPGARVDLVVSASTNTTDGVDLSELYIIDNNVADIMTESFGGCEAAFTSSEAAGIAALAEQAAAQGITYVVSSGDSGAEGCDDPNIEARASGPVSVNLLASTPFNVAVGGTMFNENNQASKYWSSTNNGAHGSALSYIPEKVWNESCTAAQCGAQAGIWAAGGGASSFFSQPSWQSGVSGIPANNARNMPDISLSAAGHDPYLLCLHASCVPDANGFISLWLVSGTSATAPAFAGIMALVDQATGLPSPSFRQGQPGYVLYSLAAKENFSQCNGSNTAALPASTCIFNDTTSGNICVPGMANYGPSCTTYNAHAGYDQATGLGSLNVSNLISKWNSVTFNGTQTTLILNSGNPLNVPHGTAVDLSITVAPLSGTGTPTGDVSLLGSFFSSFNRTGISFFPLSAGAVNTTTSVLPGGSFSVTAHYAGDKTFAPSESSPVSVVVTPENSSTALGVGGGFDSAGNIIPFSGAAYGTFVYLSAAVSGISQVGFPTGTISFNNATNTLASYPLNSVGSTASPNGIYTLPPGSYSVVAQYTGDNSFNPSSSAAWLPFSITPAPSSLLVGYTGAKTGANLNAAIQTGSGGVPPSGTVTFTLDGNSAGTVPVSGKAARTNPLLSILQGAPAIAAGAQGNSGFLDSGLPNGQHTLVASYGGDGNYAASASAPFTFNLQPDFALSSPNPGKITIGSPGGSGTLKLSVSPLDGFTGTVSFACSGLPAESTCTFSPATIKSSGGTVLTVATTPARNSELRYLRLFHAWAMSGLGFAGLLLLCGPACRGRRHWEALLGVSVLAITMVGCGGGGGSSAPIVQHDAGTMAGTYDVTINATSGSLVHKIAFQLAVQ